MVRSCQFQLSMSQVISHTENRIHTVHKRCTRTHRNQGVHVWSAVQQTADTDFKEFSVDIHDRQRQTELSQGENQHIFMTLQNRRLR